MEQVCDMYIKQNSTFVSEVIIEAAASQKIWEKFNSRKSVEKKTI